MSDLRLLRGGSAVPPTQKTVNPSKTTVISGNPAYAGSTSAKPGDRLLDSIEPGSTLGNYLIVSKVGEGGMGVVYKAHDTTLDRAVALKVLSPHLFRNQEFLQRFRIEAQAQARLNGPNIVTLHSMFEVSGSLVLVMEYIEGQTLAQRLHNEGRLSVATTVWVFEQALLGVERAHRLGIVHRDLKPSNIFITSGHEIKLMDFGVAKILDNKDLTQSGSMIGTLMYISPEQVKGKDADFRSDIYTLGITLFEAVTGRLPFEKKSDYEYMDAHLHEQPPKPASIQPDIPKELEAVILKAMDKDPDKRFQNAHEFRSALIKLGMIHVRAYRRLKTIRKDKDRAALSHYIEPHFRSPDKRPSGKSSLYNTQILWARLSLRLQRPIMVAMASLLPIAAMALVIGFYYIGHPASDDYPSDANIQAPAPVMPLAPAPAASASAVAEKPIPVTPVSNMETTHPAPIVSAQHRPEPAYVVRRSLQKRRERTAVRSASRVHPASGTNLDGSKYDALKKAWGQ
ncbi:MAG: serine/threonine protein kinase [Acidiferrobacterales bacterium]